MARLDPKPEMFCNSITPFTADGRVDVEAFRGHLRRVVAAGCSLNVGGGGSGETSFLSMGELELVYRTAVEVGKGKVPVNALTPESRNAARSLEVANIAHKAGIDRVQLYPPDMGHGGRCSNRELERYYRELLDHIDYPVALASGFPTGSVGPPMPMDLLEKLCRNYPQVVVFNIQPGYPINVFAEYRDVVWSVRPSIKLYTSSEPQFLGEYLLGSSGWYAYEPNIAPRLCQSLMDHLGAGRFEAANEAMAHIYQLNKIVQRSAPGSVRGTKTALQVLGLPGGNGHMQPPYLPILEADAKQLLAGLEGWGIRKFEGLPEKRMA